MEVQPLGVNPNVLSSHNLHTLQSSALSITGSMRMAQQLLSRALVSTKWLAGALKASPCGPALRVLDASFYYPPIRDGRKEYIEKHITGALYFDIDECKDHNSPYEVMLPSASDFAKYVGNLGINNDSQVVVYDADQVGIYYAARVWWMFRVFGHKKVFVLDGGFRNWVKEGLPVTPEVIKPQTETYKAVLNSSLLKTFEDIQRNLKSEEFQLVDTRPAGRYIGTEPEPGEGKPLRPIWATKFLYNTVIAFL